ncbi:PREDICTED: sarcalumenin-like [Branchiostoma belcheri]|uniref:Sarcalumenin-like n=1 Tax=Branchiostoma belcheri TaxID=7741 RepID=A0A6P4Z798_BRABE|nr:PREDICTED: sarcalumenin-like [Branchiostoma belcheri]
MVYHSKKYLMAKGWLESYAKRFGDAMQREYDAQRTQQDDAQRTQQDDGQRTQQDDGQRTQQDDEQRTQQDDEQRTQQEDGQRTQDEQRTQQDDEQRTQQDDGQRTQQDDEQRTQQDDEQRTQQEDGQRTQQEDGQRTQDEQRTQQDDALQRRQVDAWLLGIYLKLLKLMEEEIYIAWLAYTRTAAVLHGDDETAEACSTVQDLYEREKLARTAALQSILDNYSTIMDTMQEVNETTRDEEEHARDQFQLKQSEISDGEPTTLSAGEVIQIANVSRGATATGPTSISGKLRQKQVARGVRNKDLYEKLNKSMEEYTPESPEIHPMLHMRKAITQVESISNNRMMQRSE